MNGRRAAPFGTGPLESGEIISPEVAGSSVDRSVGSGIASLTALRAGVALAIPLLPILAVYALVSALIHPAPGDEGAYLLFAKNLTHGFYAETMATNPSAYLWHGPGLPMLLAPLLAIHVPLAVTRILVGPVLLFAAMVVFHQLVRQYLDARRAVIATYILALYLPFFMVIGRIFVEPLATLCFTLAAFFMVRSCRGGQHDHIWAGAALALLALSRVEFGYVLLVAFVLSAVWVVVSRRSPLARRSVVATLVALALCTPWLAYTYSLTSKPFYWGNSGGQSLYWMSAPGNLGDWHGKDVFTTPQLAPDRPLFTELQRLTPLEQDERLQRIAFQNIEHNPGHYLSNVVNNVGRLIFNSPYSFTNEKASSMLYAIPNGLLLGVVCIAFLVAIVVRRRLAPEIMPIAVFTALAFAVHVPVAAYARFVIPLVPVVAWLVVAVLAPYAADRVDYAARRSRPGRSGPCGADAMARPV